MARNAAGKGAQVSVYNRTQEKTDDFINKYKKEGDFIACKSLKDLVESLSPPRPILIMVKAGEAVDAVIDDLMTLIEKGDVLIDGGNSHFTDTKRRFDTLEKAGIRFVGMGISGGEEGALKGPSLMPGGSFEGVKIIEELFSKISADDGDGGRCFSYIGKGGSGHFVKMVHNGIEYGVMQLMAESYQLLKEIGEFSNEDLAEAFKHWNESEDLNSYLAEITKEIFKIKDTQSTSFLIDKIISRAGQKGTGKWTSQTALDYGVPVPTITAAVDARILSGSDNLRNQGRKLPTELDETEPIPPGQRFRFMVRASLSLSIISCYLQGFDLINKVNEEEKWGINLSETARLWRGGCIIRSVLLKKIQKLYSSDKQVSQAAREAITERFSGERQVYWRQVIEIGASRGIPLPATMASLSYFDSQRSEFLPQNLIQAQRDYFGAHGFKRTDKEGDFHGDWGEK